MISPHSLYQLGTFQNDSLDAHRLCPTMSALRPSQEDTKADIELHENPADHSLAPDANAEEIAAHLAAQEEHDQTISSAIRSNPWCLVWLAYGVWIIMCCSFDNNAGSIVFGIPMFRKDFGYAFEGDYILPPDWQSAFSGGPAAAMILGTFMSGSELISVSFDSACEHRPADERLALGEKIGRKYTCLLCYLILMTGITLEVVADTTSHPSAVFFTGKFVNGLGIGALQTTGFIYVTEVSNYTLSDRCIPKSAR